MNNDITNILGIEDSDLIVHCDPASDCRQVIHIEKILVPHYCPECNFKMHSKGVYTRILNHPIRQGNIQVIFKVKQRRWRCTNPECGYVETDSFSFFERYRRNTNLADYLIVESFRDFNLSARQIAQRHHVSDTYALLTFAKYVDMKRLPLTSAICIDEVKLDISSKYKYVLIIQDFRTGEPIDMVISRRDNVTEPYFAAIPKTERMMVKYLITDMYKPYLAYIDKYFPNAISVVDAFHVIQQINFKILQYIRSSQRKYRERDIRKNEELKRKLGRHVKLRESKEVYLLKNFRWLVLKNHSAINYSRRPFFDSKFNAYMYTSDYERELFNLDPFLKEYRDLKEQYITFNERYSGDPKAARPELISLIQIYRGSPHEIFREIAIMLDTHKEAILNSFTMSERIDKDGTIYRSRLSNGPMESLNRVPKDMKRSARGYHNFDHIRNRFLFSQRKDAPIRAVPKPIKEIQNTTGIKRGPYRKTQFKRIVQK